MSKQAHVCLNEPDKSMPMLRRSERLRAKRDSSSSEPIGEPKSKKNKKMNNPTDKESMDLINTLDHECLAKIFKYFPISERLELEKVCTRWEIIIREYAWNDIKKINFFDLKTHDYFGNQSGAHEILLRCCRYLKELAVPKIMPNSKIVSIIKENCQNLTKLRIALGVNFSKRDFMEICTAIKNLQSINIDLTNWVDPDYLLSQNSHIFDNVPDNISELFLSSKYSSLLCCSLSFNRFSSLRCLELRWCRLDSEAAERMSHMKTLVDLNLDTCSFKGSQRFVIRLPNLERITFAYLQHFKFSGEDIADSCKKLKYIDVLECDMSFKKLENAKNLEVLKLHDTLFDDSTMSAIANNCKNFKYLELSKQRANWTENSFGELEKLTSLEHLDLDLYWPQVDVHLISIISNNCPELKYLKLYHIFPLSSPEETQNILNELANLKNLEYLLLPDCKFHEDTICNIMQECKNLKYFEISFSCLTKSGIAKLPVSGNLEHLDFQRSSVINDELILCTTKKYKNLKTLNLYHCEKISHPDIKIILENCPGLEILYLNGTRIELKTLIAAAKLTKSRENEVVLTIFTGQPLINQYKTCGISSPYLLLNKI